MDTVKKKSVKKSVKTDDTVEVIALVRMNRDDGTDEMCAVGETIKKSRDAARFLQDAGKIKVKI